MLRRTFSLAVVVGLAVIAGCTAVQPGSGGGKAKAAEPAASPSPTGYLQRDGSRLVFGGQTYRVVGLNAYELATDWGNNLGCGTKLDDTTLEQFFGGLPAHSLVRMWGYQGAMATNPTTHLRDWTGLDRVVAAASHHSDLLVVSLGEQSGWCDDGHWKDRAWYSGGYRNVYPGDGYTVATTSYWDWIHEIVNRYRNSTAIGMWELINEPEASDCLPGYTGDCGLHKQCPNPSSATAALRSFVDVVGGEIKRIDPNHLVESGALGGTQCGWAGSGFSTIQASAGVDVVSFHDYFENQVLNTELAGRLADAQSLDKPLLVGELGIHGTDGVAGCATTSARSTQFGLKTAAILGAGASGVLVWDWVPSPSTSQCSYDVVRGDPLLARLGPR